MAAMGFFVGGCLPIPVFLRDADGRTAIRLEWQPQQQSLESKSVRRKLTAYDEEKYLESRDRGRLYHLSLLFQSSDGGV